MCLVKQWEKDKIIFCVDICHILDSGQTIMNISIIFI